MKKLSLLIAAGALVFGANAQVAKQRNTASHVAKDKAAFVPFAKDHAAGTANHSHQNALAKTTSVTIYPTTGTAETFDAGIPTGWTAGSYVAGQSSWVWADATTGGKYNIGNINTNPGWMVYNSDSIAGGRAVPDTDPSNSVTPAGYLQTAPINCSGHSSVRLNFAEYYEKFEDTTYILVSPSGSSSGPWDTFQIHPNAEIATNVTTANPTIAHVNITSAAANQASIRIRFVYSGVASGGYQWLIDSVSLTELDANDVSIAKSFNFLGGTDGAPSTMITRPLEFVDSIAVVTQLSNQGATAETGVNLTAKIYQGTTLALTTNSTYANLVVNALDTIVQFDQLYLPPAVGDYTIAINAAITGDADATNNIDTVNFSVSDTTYMVNSGAIVGNYYLHRGTGDGTELSLYLGARFDIPTAATGPVSGGDTLTGVGVVFGNGTDAGSQVAVQIYRMDDANWTLIGSTFTRAITAADISSSTNTVWAYFAIDTTTGNIATDTWDDFVLQPGMQYAAVVTPVNVPANKTVLVTATEASAATGFIGFLGQEDSSLNDGSANFGTTLATGLQDFTPAVRAYFGHPSTTVGVANVAATKVGAAYPNPANTTVTIPFTTVTNGTVSVTLTDVTGQVVRTQYGTATGGKQSQATFNTTGLASGIYLYNVSVNGSNATGRVVVAH